MRPVHSGRDLKRFVALPYQLYRGDPLWVPPLRRDVRTLLSRTANPFFEHGEAEYFLAWRGTKPVGRIAAISNRLHNETHEDKVGFFGFFETTNDLAVAQALLDHARDWLRKKGHDRMRGPASFSVNDECGLLVDGFNTPPTILMAHNPAWYATLLEQAGFTTAKNLLVYQNQHRGVTPERLTRATDIIKQRQGITIRPLDLQDFSAEVNRIKALYNVAWVNNWGYVPMTDHEIDHAAAQFRPVVVPEMAPIVEKDGRPIAFALALPDLNVVFRSNRSGYLLPSLPRLLWSLRPGKISRLRILLLGIEPAFRGKGIDAVLYHHIWTRGVARGFYWGEAGWILEDNPAMQVGLEKIGFSVYKTYRLYDRTL